jgi:hypothetical protein
VSASELDQSQPVIDLLAPANAQTAPFGEPAQSAFDHPTPGWETGFTGDRTFFDQWLTAFSLVFDMHDIARVLDKLTDIDKIIAFISTEMLFSFRAFDDNRDNQIIRRPLVMFIGTRQDDSQGCTALIHQNMDLAAPFTSIGRVLPGLFTTQRGGTAFTVNRLPSPLDFPSLGVELGHDPHDLVEDTQLLPGLEALMQRAAAHPKLVFVHGLPLTPGPQDIPDAVQHGSIIGAWSPWPTLLRRFGQNLLDLAPQGSGHLKVIDIFRFLGRVLTHGAPRFRWVTSIPILYELHSIFHTPLNLRIDTK